MVIVGQFYRFIGKQKLNKIALKWDTVFRIVRIILSKLEQQTSFKFWALNVFQHKYCPERISICESFKI